MFDHVTIRATDPAAAEHFYATVLATLGVEAGRSEWGEFAVAPADDGRPPTRRLHIGFAAASRAHVDAFWRAGTAAGYRDDGAPGPRPRYRHDYYGGFVLDPDGNSVEAVHHGGVGRDGLIDHLWIRVADVDAAAAFYDGVASIAGLRRRETGPELARFAGATGSFTLIADGPPTAGLELTLAGRAPAPAATDPDGNTVAVVARRGGRGSDAS